MDAILRDRRAALVFVGSRAARLHAGPARPDRLVARLHVLSGNAIEGFKYVGLAQLPHADSRPVLLAGAEVHAEVRGRRHRAAGRVRAICSPSCTCSTSAAARRSCGRSCSSRSCYRRWRSRRCSRSCSRSRRSTAPSTRSCTRSAEQPVQDWLAHGSSAFFVLVLMDVWRSMGFYAVLLYAGLVDIPEDVIESARLDGASGYRLLRQSCCRSSAQSCSPH